MITMGWFSYKPTVQNLDTHTRVNTLDLDAFSYNRFTWWLHTHKANIIFLIFLIIITLIGLYAAKQMNTDQCTSDKAELGICFGANTALILFTYLCIWPHTQWKTLSPQSSKFLGTTAIAHQQALASQQFRIETPTRYLDAAPEPPIVQSVITPIPEPVPKVEEPEAPSWFSNFINSMAGMEQYFFQDPPRSTTRSNQKK